MVDQTSLEQTLLTLLSFPSPQPDMDAVRRFIATVVRPMAEAAQFDRVMVDRAGNLVAERRGTDPSLLPLLWYTYAGTYPAARMPDPYPGRRLEEQGAIYLRGRGAAEQRTGLAAVLEALRALAGRERPRRGLLLATTLAGEMGNHLVAEALLQEHGLRAAGAVLAIATGAKIGLGNLGRVDVHVEVEGASCHSSDPSRGVNAISGAVEFCRRLEQLPPLPQDPRLGQATLTVTAIDSEPKASHTIPSRCTLTLDRRLVPGESPEAAVAQLAALADGIAPQRVTVRAGHFNQPGSLPPESPLVQLAVAAATEAGLCAPFFYRRAALDAGFLIRHGIPAIMWGPGDPTLAHTDEERVRLSDAVSGARAYYALTALACWERPAALG